MVVFLEHSEKPPAIYIIRSFEAFDVNNIIAK